jgi:hypothetical protein
VRLVVPFLFVLAVALFGAMVASSCVLDYRDAEAGMDGEAGPAEVAMADAAIEADVADVDLDCGCCIHEILPLLPYCSGKVAFAIPSGDCTLVACSGPVAYALCGDGCYTSCACELPSDYEIFDAGFYVGEGGP